MATGEAHVAQACRGAGDLTPPRLSWHSNPSGATAQQHLCSSLIVVADLKQNNASLPRLLHNELVVLGLLRYSHAQGPEQYVVVQL